MFLFWYGTGISDIPSLRWRNYYERDIVVNYGEYPESFINVALRIYNQVISFGNNSRVTHGPYRGEGLLTFVGIKYKEEERAKYSTTIFGGHLLTCEHTDGSSSDVM